MVNKEEILAVKAEMQDIQRDINAFSEKHNLKAKELLNKVLSCKEVLTETKWDLQGYQTLCSRDTKHKMLSEFLQTDYHCHFENDDLYLNFDDWDISLNFKSREGLVQFIEKFGIVLDVDYLRKKLELGKKEVKNLEAEIKKIEELNHVAM